MLRAVFPCKDRVFTLLKVRYGNRKKPDWVVGEKELLKNKQIIKSACPSFVLLHGSIEGSEDVQRTSHISFQPFFFVFK